MRCQESRRWRAASNRVAEVVRLRLRKSSHVENTVRRLCSPEVLMQPKITESRLTEAQRGKAAERKYLKKGVPWGEMVKPVPIPHSRKEQPMHSFLQRFALLVAGVLHGFDRLVFKGKLCPLYSPEGMNCLLRANHVLYKDFKNYAYGVTAKVIEASLASQARALGRYRYLKSCKIDKDEVAREILAKQPVKTGLVCVLSCVEPCWTFDKATTKDGSLTVRGEPGKCSHLYHYFIHPQFGWMYVRLQTWFPFEIQVGINGREWLARQLDQDKLAYLRSDNKI